MKQTIFKLTYKYNHLDTPTFNLSFCLTLGQRKKCETYMRKKKKKYNVHFIKTGQTQCQIFNKA